jgi:hypothetical protein
MSMHIRLSEGVSLYSVAAMKAAQIAATMKSDHVLKNATSLLKRLACSLCSSRASSVVDMAKIPCAPNEGGAT